MKRLVREICTGDVLNFQGLQDDAEGWGKEKLVLVNYVLYIICCWF
jgi:hypothetical protein